MLEVLVKEALKDADLYKIYPHFYAKEKREYLIIKIAKLMRDLNDDVDIDINGDDHNDLMTCLSIIIIATNIELKHITGIQWIQFRAIDYIKKTIPTHHA